MGIEFTEEPETADFTYSESTNELNPVTRTFERQFFIKKGWPTIKVKEGVGYSGFFTEFFFNAEGKYVCHGCFE